MILVPMWYRRHVAMTLRTDEELDAALTALAAAEGASRQEIIRRAVLDRHDRVIHSARVTESTNRLIAKWSDVLERLGSV